MRTGKRVLFGLLALAMLLTLLPGLAMQGRAAGGEAETPSPAFRDVTDGAWYEDAVRYVCEAGLMTGTGPVLFSPHADLTRAQLVTILWRKAGEPVVDAVLPFSDVKEGAWYAEAARWAAAEKLADSGSAFAPNEALSRQETALLLWRYAKYAGADVSAGTNLTSCSDAFELAEPAVPAMQWAVGAGVIQGMDGGRLSPNGHLTRAQAAAMLMRLDEMQDPLGFWTENAPARQALISYMNAVTEEGGPDYIPVEDRIAVFDLDGTLCCETDPVYFDHCLLYYRVMEDPDYKDKASDFEKEVAEKIGVYMQDGKYPSGMDVDHGKAVASAFSGMTVAEFEAYVQSYKNQSSPSYEGMTRGEAFYQPMVQVVNYLTANDFTVYIVSGTDRLIVRGLVAGSVLNIPRNQIIGSDETIVASGQGDTDGLDYQLAGDDQLILGGTFLIKNLKMNKVSVIMQEIGQQPVLAFGNSSGDSSMLNYTISGNPYKSQSFMLCCDDLERENGSLSKAKNMLELCETFGWVPVSMKNDWTTIYGPGVTYLGASEAEEAA